MGGRGGGLSRRDLVVCGGNEARVFLMQRAMAGGEQGQGGGGQHGFGHDGRGADDGCHGLGDHVGGGQRRSVAQYQGSGDRPNCMVGDNTGQTAGSCGGDGQDGGENSLRGKTPLTRALLPDLTLLLRPKPVFLTIVFVLDTLVHSQSRVCLYFDIFQGLIRLDPIQGSSYLLR